jgi:outer membrane protein assembly factor BamB
MGGEEVCAKPPLADYNGTECGLHPQGRLLFTCLPIAMGPLDMPFEHTHPRGLRVIALFLCLFVSALVLIGPTGRAWAARGALVDESVAQRYGLERMWFSQAQLDPSRHRVEHVVLHKGELFVLTTSGTLHVMNAETGRTVWIQRMGNPNYPSLGPGVNDNHVAMVNGSTLYVLERKGGREILQRSLGGGAAGGPALTDTMAFVPLFSGKVEGYAIAEPRNPALYFSSAGRIFASPLATADSIVWPTDAGILYVGNASGRGMRFRFESTSPFAGNPAAKQGLLYATAASGYVYAINEQNGNQRWRYATGAPTSRSPVVVGSRVFVATNLPSLHCLDAATGEFLWEAPDIRQVVAVSRGRAYGINRVGDITILDVNTGIRQGRLQTSGTTSAVLNDQTDRLYLVSESGLLQCLREIGATEPLNHNAAPPAEGQPAEGTPPAGEEEDPFGAPAEDDPFGAPAEDDPFGEAMPEAEPAGEADPFGESDPPAENPDPFGEQPPAEDPFGEQPPAEQPPAENPFGF